jgi:hypothetical protein
LTDITAEVEKIADNLYSVEPNGIFVVSCSSIAMGGNIIAIAFFFHLAGIPRGKARTCKCPRIATVSLDVHIAKTKLKNGTSTNKMALL